MPLTAVVFDVDGTLVDTVDLHAQAWVETLRDFGVEAPFDEVRAQIGKGGDTLLPVFVRADVLEDKQEEMEHARSERYARDFMPHAKPFPAVRELFEALRARGRRIALASSGKAEEVDRYKRMLGVADLLDAGTTADDAERSKPFPDIFQAALARLGIDDPSQAVVVGDTPYDAEAAAKAGLRTIGVLCGGFPEASLRDAGCVAIYRDPAHLLAELDRSPLAE
jgi:HAD superfamily hydrolase (TIGR01509 family)